MSVPLVLVLVLVLVAGPPDASAATNQFRGVNWARAGDDFTGEPLILYGLISGDSYSVGRAKADAVLAGFESNLGANTVRLPVNTSSVGTAWWNSFTGVLDSATARGMKVILSFWDDGRASSGGWSTDTAAYNAMWDTVVAKYGADPLVHFEPMNEPAGYSAAEWKKVAAAWLAARPSVPRNRVFISGSGLNQDIKTMCAGSRFDGTYLSLHHYTFFSSAKMYDGWVNHLRRLHLRRPHRHRRVRRPDGHRAQLRRRRPAAARMGTHRHRPAARHPGATTANNTQVAIYDCNTGANQHRPGVVIATFHEVRSVGVPDGRSRAGYQRAVNCGAVLLREAWTPAAEGS